MFCNVLTESKGRLPHIKEIWVESGLHFMSCYLKCWLSLNDCTHEKLSQLYCLHVVVWESEALILASNSSGQNLSWISCISSNLNFAVNFVFLGGGTPPH